VSDATTEYGIRFWVCVPIGAALMVWGTVLFLEMTPSFDQRINFVAWVVGSNLAHDLAIAPAICVVGAVVARWPPAWLRAPLQVGLLASASVLTVAWLPLRGTAAGTANPSIQPLDYVTATATVLAVVWASVSLWGWHRWRS
jgi:hypothetical protein